MKYIFYSFKEQNFQLADSFLHSYEISAKYGDTHIITSNSLDTNIIGDELDIKTPKTVWLVPTVLKNDFDKILKTVLLPNEQTSSRDYNPSDLSVDGQEEELKKVILSKISENENLTTDSIIFSEILEVNKVPVPPPPPQENMKFIFYKCQHQVLPGVLDFCERVDTNVFIVSNNVDFNYQKADSILNNQAEFYLIPTKFKDNYFLHCIERFENKNSSNKEIWEDNKTNLKKEEEAKLKGLILTKIAGGDNPTINSITFSEILEIKKIALPKSQEGGITLRDILAVLIVVFFVVALFVGVIIPSDPPGPTMEKAKQAFLDGDFDKAKALAGSVSQDYLNTMKVAIKEIEKPIKPEPKPEPEPTEVLKILKNNANRAFDAEHWTTPVDDNVVLWTSQMLKIAPSDTKVKSFVKNMLKKVIDKYLELHRNGRLTKQQLDNKLDTPVLKKKLKDYAN